MLGAAHATYRVRRVASGVRRDGHSRLTTHCQCSATCSATKPMKRPAAVVCTPRHIPFAATVMPSSGTTVWEIIKPVKMIVVIVSLSTLCGAESSALFGVYCESTDRQDTWYDLWRVPGLHHRAFREFYLAPRACRQVRGYSSASALVARLLWTITGQ